ncbi:MAG: transposase [Candidatus Bathyarchaeia archaeon]
MKRILAVELRSQLVYGFKARRLARHDLADFKPVLEKASLKPSVVVADRGYDAEYAHEYVREKLGSYSIIPPRCRDVPVWRTRGG